MSFKEFISQFKQYDTKKTWSENEIKKLYTYTINVYGVVDENNFNVWYAINNKERVNF